MPQLKKVVLVAGSRLIYADTYEQALAQLAGGAGQPAEQPAPASAGTASAPAAAAVPPQDPRLARIRDHLRRYRELAAQGKWSEAGKELEAIDAEAGR